MGKILAVDYGSKRVGLAITDEMNIIATPLEAVPSNEIYVFLEQLFSKENISTIVIGDPRDLQNKETDITKSANTFSKNVKKKFPFLQVQRVDERFTSKMALSAMIAGGTKKKYRREKGNLDKISATIILQSYLETI